MIGLGLGDVDRQIGRTWIDAEDLRAIFDRRSRYAAEQHLRRWLVHCADPTIPELHRLARTVDACRDELVVTPTATVCPMGPPKQSTPQSKRSKRIGYGYRNFNNYRLRLLLHCGIDWHTPQPAPNSSIA